VSDEIRRAREQYEAATAALQGNLAHLADAWPGEAAVKVEHPGRFLNLIPRSLQEAAT
jgi:uncharacterized protein YukE